jgi:hypothetical protein
MHTTAPSSVQRTGETLGTRTSKSLTTLREAQCAHCGWRGEHACVLSLHFVSLKVEFVSMRLSDRIAPSVRTPVGAVFLSLYDLPSE